MSRGLEGSARATGPALRGGGTPDGYERRSDGGREAVSAGAAVPVAPPASHQAKLCPPAQLVIVLVEFADQFVFELHNHAIGPLHWLVVGSTLHLSHS